jgi:flagellar motor switch protein FliN/FliY
MADESSNDQSDAQQPAATTPSDQASLDQSVIDSLLGGGAKADGPSVSSPGAQATPPVQPEVAENATLGQEGIDKLLEQAGTALAGQATKVAHSSGGTVANVDDGTILPDDVDYLLHQAEKALESVNRPADGQQPPGVSPFHFEEFSGAAASTEKASLDLIRDVELDLKIELGRTHMYLEDVLKLRKGSVVPLDKLAGDPVDIYVNGRLIARGEVLVLSDNFCVRVAELIAGTELSV